MKTEELRKEIINNYMSRWTRLRSPKTRWEINDDYSVDVYGDLYVSIDNQTLPFKFRNYTGDVLEVEDLDQLKNPEFLPDRIRRGSAFFWELEIFYNDGIMQHRYNKIYA